MSNKNKIIIAAGGTGGHVFPGVNLAKHLINENYYVKLVSDKRGYKYFKDITGFDISILPSSPLLKKNIISLILSSIFIFYSIFRSIFFLIVERPKIIFGMGGYASFPICIAARVLKIHYIIYENNLIIGKANKYLLPFAKKILISKKEVEGIPNKYLNKTFEIGNIIKKEIINFSPKHRDKENKKLSILILGGSQAAKIFAEILPSIFKECINQKIPLKIYQHCLPDQNEFLSDFYKKNNIEFEIFNFSINLEKYFFKVDLALTRSGSSVLAELTNANVPFISVPLPSSADNHQFKNAIYYQKKNLALMIEEKELNDKLLQLIKTIYSDKSYLDNIISNQRQFSDKNVYHNITKQLKNIIHEKN